MGHPDRKPSKNYQKETPGENVWKSWRHLCEMAETIGWDTQREGQERPIRRNALRERLWYLENFVRHGRNDRMGHPDRKPSKNYQKATPCEHVWRFWRHLFEMADTIGWDTQRERQQRPAEGTPWENDCGVSRFGTAACFSNSRNQCCDGISRHLVLTGLGTPVTRVPRVWGGDFVSTPPGGLTLSWEQTA